MRIISKYFKKLTPDFAIWWAGAFLSIVVFTLLWCHDTTFRTMSILAYYPNNILLALLLCLPAMVTKRRWVQLIVLLLFDALLEANLMYCRTYFNAIPAESYFLASNLKDFTASVFDSLRLRDILILIPAIATYIISLRRRKDEKKRPTWAVYSLTALVLLVCSWGVALLDGGYRAHMAKLTDSCYFSTCVAPTYTVFGFVTYDAIYGNQPLSDEKRAEVMTWLADNKKLTPATPTHPKRNIVLILCESFESWPIGLSVDGNELTPYINSLVADTTTLFVPNVATQVGAGRSIDAQLLVMAGMYPMNRNVYSVKAPTSTYYTIPKAFKEHGGSTWLMTCDRPHVWNEKLVVKAFGIDTFLHDTSWVNDQPIGVTKRLSDKRLMEQSVEKLKAGEILPVGEYGFATWVTYSGHAPFVLPEELRNIHFAEGKYPEVIVNYMTDINYTDSALKVLIEYFKTRPDWENTSIVIIGDHEGLANYRSSVVADKNCGFVSKGQFTPFIVVNSPVGGRIDKTVGQIDIYPTIIELAGINDYTWQGFGKSVLSAEHPNAAINYNHEIIGAGNGSDLQKQQQYSDIIIRYDLFK